eukprot:281804_1
MLGNVLSTLERFKNKHLPPCTDSSPPTDTFDNLFVTCDDSQDDDAFLLVNNHTTVPLRTEQSFRASLLSGYLRQYIDANLLPKQYGILLFQNIPHGIIQLIGRFFQTNVQFTIFDDHYTSIATDTALGRSRIESTNEHRNRHRICLSDIGYNKGYIQWKIRCESDKSCMPMIGVAGNVSQ